MNGITAIVTNDLAKMLIWPNIGKPGNLEMPDKISISHIAEVLYLAWQMHERLLMMRKERTE